MNNAIINFLFNTEGANREIDNFKSRFDKTIKAISDSSIGKFAAIGGGLASIFSIKQFITDTKELSRAFNDMNGKVPIEKIGRFVNLMGSLGVEQSEALSTLQDLEKKLLKPWENEKFTAAVSQLGLNIADYKKDNEVLVNEFYDDLRDKFAEKKELEPQMYLDLMGISTAPMDRYLGDLPLGMDIKTFREEIEKMPTITNDSYTAMMNMSFAMQNLRAQARGLGETLVEQGIDQLILNIANALKKFNDLSPETKEKILKTVGAFVLLWSTITLLKPFFGLFAFSLKSPLFWVLLLTSAVVALTTNLGNCRKKLAEFLNDAWTAFNDPIISAIGGLDSKRKQMLETNPEFKKIFEDLIKKDREKIKEKGFWGAMKSPEIRLTKTASEYFHEAMVIYGELYRGHEEMSLKSPKSQNNSFNINDLLSNSIGEIEKSLSTQIPSTSNNNNMTLINYEGITKMMPASTSNSNNTTVINYTDNSTKNINTNNPRAVDEALYQSGVNFLMQKVAFQQ